MDKIEIRQIEDKKLWEDFLSNHKEASFLQSFTWGEFHKSLGHKIWRSGFFKNGVLVGVMLSILEQGRRAKYLTVPGGPIIDWDDKSQTLSFVDEIKRIAKEEGCVFIRVRPQLKDEERSRQIFSSLGFKKAPMHLHAELTNRLNLTPDEQTLLANMRKTTRYEIRKAEKIGVEVTDEYSEKYINEFIKDQKETAKRQNFVPFSDDFLLKQFDLFIKEGSAKLYTSLYEGKVLAQAFVIFYGDEAVYHYGASTEEGRKYPGAYLIQWRAILEAKRRGMTYYNFWGVAPIEETTHRFYKISVFKRGFAGEEWGYLPAQDLVVNSIKYSLNFAVEFTRKKMRGL